MSNFNHINQDPSNGNTVLVLSHLPQLLKYLRTFSRKEILRSEAPYPGMVIRRWGLSPEDECEVGVIFKNSTYYITDGEGEFLLTQTDVMTDRGLLLRTLWLHPVTKRVKKLLETDHPIACKNIPKCHRAAARRLFKVTGRDQRVLEYVPHSDLSRICRDTSLNIKDLGPTITVNDMDISNW